MARTKKHIFIIPVFNEAKIIKKSVNLILNYLKTRPNTEDWKIVVADNGSSDNTQQILKKLSLPKSSGPKLDYVKINQKGRGNALKHVITKQSADYYYYSDADIPFRVSDLSGLIEKLTSGKSSIVVGKRSGSRPLKRKIITRGLRWLTNMLFNLHVSDPQCGLKGFDRKAAKVLTTKCQQTGYFLDTEFLVLSNNSGLKVDEQEINWIESRYSNRTSKVHLLPDSIEAIKTLMNLCSRIYPNFVRNYTLLIGTGLFILGVFIFGKFSFVSAGVYPAHHIKKLMILIQFQAILLAIAILGLYLVFRLTKSFPWKFFLANVITIFILIATVTIITVPTRSADPFWNVFLVKSFVKYGLNPYQTTPIMLATDPWYGSISAWQKLAMTHGPLWIYILYLPTLLTKSLRLTLVLGKLEALMALGLVGLIFWKLAARYKLDDKTRTMAIMLFLWNPFVIQNVLVDFHNDVFVMLAILFGLWAYKNKKFVLSSLSIFLAALIKYVPVILIILPALSLLTYDRLPRRSKLFQTLLLLVTMTVMLILVYWPFHPSLNHWPGLVNEINRNRLEYYLPGTLILQKLLHTSPIVVKAVGLIGAVLITIYYSLRKKELLAFSIPLLFIFVFGLPWFQSWYVLWIFPILLLYTSVTRIALLSVFLLLVPDVFYPIQLSILLIVIISMYFVLKNSILNNHSTNLNKA